MRIIIGSIKSMDVIIAHITQGIIIGSIISVVVLIVLLGLKLFSYSSQ